jgi:transaldolase
MPMREQDLRIKVFADGADLEGIRQAALNPLISGFTTNPTLMRKAGVDDYERFGREVLAVVPDLPISFEVFSDDPEEMVEQALKLASWGDNVYVKVPVTNTEGRSSAELVRHLSGEGVKLNVTALLTVDQVVEMADVLRGGPASYISVFAGRIADTGRDPVPLMAAALAVVRTVTACELIWASPREVLNIVQADQIGCDVITVTNDLLAKVSLFGKDLRAYSLDTVRMFREDAVRAGYQI